MSAEHRYAGPLDYSPGKPSPLPDEPIRVGSRLWVLTDLWDSYREFAKRVDSSGLASVILAAPFIQTVYGTDRYVDELW